MTLHSSDVWPDFGHVQASQSQLHRWHHEHCICAST